MFNTIKSKFIIFSLILIILSIGIPVGFLLEQVNRNFHERSVIMIEAAIDLMINGLNESMMKGDKKSIQKIVEQISDKASIDHIRIFNENGIIKYSNHSFEIGNEINVIDSGHIEKEIPNIIDRQVYLDKISNAYKAIQPILVEERCQSCHKENAIISYLDVDTDFTKAEIKYYTGSFHMIFLGIALILILAYGFYYLFNKYINEPLSECMFALDSIEAGNLDIKLSVRGNDEFSILHNHFNKMVEELKYSREKIDELHFDQLQRADKMVTLGELTATMAHDINNHSAIIMSRADYLLYEAENANLPLNLTGDLEVINNQIEKISKITRNILKHSKKLSKKFNNIDLVSLVDSIIEMLQPIAVKKKISIGKNFETNKAIVYGDPNQLEQVILNLVSNALDANTEGGNIEICISKNENSQAELKIEDNGIGIDEESLKMIFSPFYTNKEKDKGTGLGLYIVENICKNHNATVKCESKVGEGTAFTITFSSEVK